MLSPLRSEIERKVPVANGGGGDQKNTPDSVTNLLRNSGLAERLEKILDKHPKIRGDKLAGQLGALGGGNHFIEICIDESDSVWVMLHSGSRGTGNIIGTYFIERARNELLRRELGYHVPDRDLAFFAQGEPLFDDYIEAVVWAQDYARANRETMMSRVLMASRAIASPFQLSKMAVNCHHNYVQKEEHFGEMIWLTRKEAFSARVGEYGIIPGSMGARSFRPLEARSYRLGRGLGAGQRLGMGRQETCEIPRLSSAARAIRKAFAPARTGPAAARAARRPSGALRSMCMRKRPRASNAARTHP